MGESTIKTDSQLREAVALKLQYEKLHRELLFFCESLGIISYAHDPERFLMKLIEEYSPPRKLD